MTRKEIDQVTAISQEAGLAGIVSLQRSAEGFRSSAGSAISDSEIKAVLEAMEATDKDVVFIGSGRGRAFLEQFSIVRTELAKRYMQIDPNLLAFAFIVDFPLFEYNELEKRLDPVHHMFVMPRDEDTKLLETDPLKVMSTQYDVVCNGYELCSGSRRIHNSDLQRQVMRLIGLSDEEIEQKFSHLLTAFSYGAPPHGGAAPGLDRILMVLLGTNNIRDVIPFPKTQKGLDLMMQSPSPANETQLAELALTLDEDRLGEEN